MKLKRLLPQFRYGKYRETLQIMRITFFLQAVFVFQLAAHPSGAQHARIKLETNHIPVSELIQAIERQTNYLVVYSHQEVNTARQVVLRRKSAKVLDVLDDAFAGTPITYVFDNDYIILKARPMDRAPLGTAADQAATGNLARPELAHVDGLRVAQQPGRVTGTVVDAAGQPVSGATVLVSGTTRSAMTDDRGRFAIAADAGAVLIVSNVGFVSRQIQVAGQQALTIPLMTDDRVIDEVVVVGFGTQKKVNLTGAVGVADASVFENRPVTNAVNALQGAVPGLAISNTAAGGELNASKSIRIRGQGTIGSGSSGDPLVLVDGMEGNLVSINPQDIESVSVLKDASAAAIYGARAAFGVILVTTKSGKSGKNVFNYNNSFRFNTQVMLPDLMDSWQFVNYFNDAQFNTSNNALYTADYLKLVKDYYDGVTDPSVAMYVGSGGRWNGDFAYGNHNWLNEYYSKWSPAQEHNLSLNGGTDRVTYYLTAGIMDQDGFMRHGTENYTRYNLTAKVGAKITEYFRMDYVTRFNRIAYDRPTAMTAGFYNDILRRARPVRPVFDPNGYLANDIHYIGMMTDGGRYQDQSDEHVQQLKATLTPLPDWTITGDFNVRIRGNSTHQDQQIVYSHSAENPEVTYRSAYSPSADGVSEVLWKSTFLNPNIYTNYARSFGGHNLSGTAGMQHERSFRKFLSGGRTGILNPLLPSLDLTNGVMSVAGNEQEWATTGFFGRANYDFDARYLLELNARYDGSSRFRRDRRWVWSPSVSAGWNIAEETWWGDAAEVVGLLKIRGSYGQLANQNTDDLYPTYSTIGTGIANGRWLINGVQPNTSVLPGLVSSLLTWERVQTRNIALDWGMLDNRLTGSFDYYVRETKDMVGAGVELPAIFGAAVPNTNNMDLESVGWELDLGWKDRVADFSYGIRVNLADVRTRVTKFPNATGALSTRREGEWLGNIYGFTTVGIARSDEEMQAHLASLPNGGQNALGNQWTAGDIMYADLNGDGKVDPGAQTITDMGDLSLLGNNTPRLLTGINIDLAWKGFTLNAFFQGVLKRDYEPWGMVFWGANSGGQWWSTAFTDHLDYFRADADHVFGQNLDAYYPRPMFNGKNHLTQSKYIQSAAYLRLKNLQLGYTVPTRFTQRFGLQQLRVFGAGENLLTFTKLTRTLDPETAGVGVHGGSIYPLSRVFAFGLNVNF